jgi:hypothetical protein
VDIDVLSEVMPKTTDTATTMGSLPEIRTTYQPTVHHPMLHHSEPGTIPAAIPASALWQGRVYKASISIHLLSVTGLRRPTIGVDVQLENRRGSDRSVS